MPDELVPHQLRQLAEIDSEVARLDELLSRKLPELKDFRKAGLIVIWGIIRQFMEGGFDYRNAEEAMKVAEKMMALMNGAQLNALGEEIEKVPTEDHKAVLEELTAAVAQRQGKS